jgi:ABC-2 type transport system permease protein
LAVAISRVDGDCSRDPVGSPDSNIFPDKRFVIYARQRMTAVRAMAWREIRRQLTSPASWLIVGLFALLAGGVFVTTLNAFLDQSSQALSVPPPQPVNVNQLLIRPLLLQIGLAALLVLPLITARAYTQERRADALEPLQPSPVMNLQIVLATFVGTLTLYAVMLLASMALVAVLFVYGAPEWGSILSGYLGLLLTGAAFISMALFISSLATSAAAAGIATFAISLMLAAATWLARSGAPGAQPVFRYFSVGEGLDDFAKGVVDSGHIVSCLTISALGLFLTLRALEPQRSGN